MSEKQNTELGWDDRKGSSENVQFLIKWQVP